MLKIICIFILAGNYAAAQIISTKQTESPSVEFLGKSGPLFLTAESYKGKEGLNHSLTINAYDEGLDLKKSTEIKGRNHNDDSEYFLIDSIVYITLDKKEGQYEKFLIGNMVLPGGESRDPGIEIFNINANKEFRKLASENYSFFTKVSTSGKSLLFVYENDYLEKYNNEIKVRVFYGNDSMSEIKTLKIPYSCNMSLTRNYVFNDLDGEKVYVLVSIYDKASERKRKVIQTQLFEFNLKTSMERMIEIPVGSDYSACKLTYCDSQLLLAFLKKDISESAFSGLTFVVWNDTLKFFKDVNLAEPLSTKWKFIKGGNDTYRLRSLDLLGQTNIIAIVEKNNRESVSNGAMLPAAGGGGMMTIGGGQTSYLAEDLFVAGLDMASGHQYIQVINKKQDFERETYVSFLLFKRGAKAQLLFTDQDVENGDPLLRNNKVNVYEIGDTVKMGAAANFNNDFFKQNRRYRFQTRSFVKLSDDTVVIAATIKSKETYLLKLKLND